MCLSSSDTISIIRRTSIKVISKSRNVYPLQNTRAHTHTREERVRPHMRVCVYMRGAFILFLCSPHLHIHCHECKFRRQFSLHIKVFWGRGVAAGVYAGINMHDKLAGDEWREGLTEAVRQWNEFVEAFDVNARNRSIRKREKQQIWASGRAKQKLISE